MARKFLSACLLSALMVPAVVQSLGLGEIRLNSYLNQPLDAEIELTLSSPDELRSLQLSIPDRDTFERLGLDRPDFLGQVEFEVDSGPGSRATVKVRSLEPVVEPFLTFLVEATWTGGRLLREYTVLLDPPAFMPEGEAPAPAPVQAPVQPTQGELTRPAPAPAPVPAASPAPEPAPTPAAPVAGEASPGTYGPVQRNETLWSIANGLRPGDEISVNQMMMALYDANPGAFEGNINELRAGTVLRVPDRAEIIRLAPDSATAAVREQNSAWRGRIERPRLELVPPAEEVGDAPVAGAATAGAAAGADTAGAAETARLSAELESSQRLLAVKDAEIARLQERLATLEAAAAQAEAPAGDGVEDLAVVAGDAAAVGEGLEPGSEAALEQGALEEVPLDQDVPLDEVALDAEDADVLATGDEAGAEVVAEAETPAPAEETAPEPEPTVVAPVVPEPSLMDRLFGLLGSLWLWLVLGLALLAAAALWFVRSRREEEDFTSTWASETEQVRSGDTQTLEPPSRARPADIVVEEQPLAKAETAAPAAAAVSEEELFAPEAADTMDALDTEDDLQESDEDYQYPFEDTIAGDAAMALEQQDPLAEADFHMAYGLYDQAAELVKGAIAREPDRMDLRRKLLDICFVWGNQEEFLAQADEFRGLVGESGAGEWNKVAIMGRQIAPDSPLFQEAEAEMGGADLDLAFGEAVPEGDAPSGDPDVLDFDLGGTTGEAPAIDEPAETDEDKSEAVLSDSGVIDFDVGSTNEYRAMDSDVEPTRQAPAISEPPAGEHTEELAIEDLGLDLDLGETGQHALDELAEQGPDIDLGEAAEELPIPADLLEESAEDIEATREQPADDGLASVEGDLLDDDTAVAEAVDEDDTAVAEALAEDDTAVAEAIAEETGLTEVVPGADTGRTEIAEIIGDDETAIAEVVGDDIVGSTGVFSFDETSVIKNPDPEGTAVYSEDDDEITDAVEHAEREEGTWVQPRPGLGDDDDTLHPGEMAEDDTVIEAPAGGDEDDTATVSTLAVADDGDADPTAEYESVADDELDLEDLTAALKADVEKTAEYPAAGSGDETGGTGLLEELLGDDQATQIAPGLAGIMSGRTVPGEGEGTAQVKALEPDPITLSEVGTKLDLARAYIDMGDPDGARSILDEVMDEGTDGQKDEARQLIDSLT